MKAVNTHKKDFIPASSLSADELDKILPFPKPNPVTEIEILTIAICCIADALAMHQVIHDEKKLYTTLLSRNPNLTEDMYDRALRICDENAVITGRCNGVIYQTNSLFNKLSMEDLNVFINQLSVESN